MSYFAPSHSELHKTWWIAATEAHQNGTPSALPTENIYKRFVEDHRWGKHHDHQQYCPACVARLPRTESTESKES